MASIFITYADDRFMVSADRIVRQARRSGAFDKVVRYTPKNLPEFVCASPLFMETKGGGCWCWKPYIIKDALSHCKVGDIVYYADAGCSIIADSPEWEEFNRYLQNHSAVFFQYRRDFSYPGWEQYCRNDCTDKTAIYHWMKPSLFDYFKQYGVPEMFEFDSLWAGFIIIKKTERASTILDEWLRITLFCPELVVPPYGIELLSLPEVYFDHRCDQAILTPLVFLYKDKDNALVIPENSESRIGHAAIVATRWRQAKLSPLAYLKYRIWSLLHDQ